MDLEIAKNFYIAKSQEIMSFNEAMARDNYGFFEMITKSKLKSYKDKLGEFYGWLRECDEAYAGSISTSGTINDLLMKHAQLGIVERSRGIFIFSLNSYEKELANIEGNLNFKLTTCVAVLAIVISIIF